MTRPHEHPAFTAHDGQVLGRLIGGQPALAAEIRGHLTAEQPHQEGEHQEGQGQPERHEQRERPPAKRTSIQGADSRRSSARSDRVVDRLDTAGEDADRLGRPEGAEGQRAEPERVVMRPRGEERVDASMVARAAILWMSSFIAAPSSPRTMPMSSRPTRYGGTRALGFMAGLRVHGANVCQHRQDRRDMPALGRRANEKAGDAHVGVVIDLGVWRSRSPAAGVLRGCGEPGCATAGAGGVAARPRCWFARPEVGVFPPKPSFFISSEMPACWSRSRRSSGSRLFHSAKKRSRCTGRGCDRSAAGRDRP